MLVLICGQTQQVPGKAQPTDEMTYTSCQALEIDRKCEMPGNSGHQFALYAGDLVLLCDKKAPNRCKMNTSGNLSAKDHSVSAVAPTQTSEFNLASPSVQISGLSFDMGCPSRMGASSSPCHQRCLRLYSYKLWWMRAVKHQLHGVFQSPRHTHHRVVKSFVPPIRINTNGTALIQLEKRKKSILQ